MLVTGHPQPGREGLAAQGAHDQLEGPQTEAGGRLHLPVGGPGGVPEGGDEAGWRQGGLLLQGGEGGAAQGLKLGNHLLQHRVAQGGLALVREQSPPGNKVGLWESFS